MRNFLSIIAGLAAGFVIISLVEMLGVLIHPPPANFDFSNEESMKQYIQTLPVGAMLLVILAWALGSFFAGMVTAMITNNQKIKVALITGAILFIAGLVNLFRIPHPVWVWILGLAVYFPFVYAGGKLGEKLKPVKANT